MHDRKAAGNPVANLRFRNCRAQALLFNRVGYHMLRRLGTKLLPWTPEILRVVGSRARIVRTRFVDDWHFQPFRIGLFLTGHIDVHPIELAVTVGIKFRFHP